MANKKVKLQEFLKSAHRLSGKLSNHLETIEGKVSVVLPQLSMARKLDFYCSLTNLQNTKSQIISNTVTEIQNNGRRQEASYHEGRKTTEAPSG